MICGARIDGNRLAARYTKGRSCHERKSTRPGYVCQVLYVIKQRRYLASFGAFHTFLYRPRNAFQRIINTSINI